MKRRIASIVIVSAILFVLMASPFAARVYAATVWTMTITATAGFDVAHNGTLVPLMSNNILGVANDATYLFDTAYDALPPPPPNQGFDTYFYYASNPSGNKSLWNSIIPPSNDMNWTYRLTPKDSYDPSRTMTVTLNWTDPPAGYNTYLQTTGGANLTSMTPGGSYSFSADEGVLSQFLIRVQVALPIPEFPIGPILVLLVCFASYGAFRSLKRISYPTA